MEHLYDYNMIRVLTNRLDCAHVVANMETWKMLVCYCVLAKAPLCRCLTPCHETGAAAALLLLFCYALKVVFVFKLS